MKSRLSIGLLIMAVSGSAFLAGCTSKITQEQLNELRRLRGDEVRLNQEISGAKAELEKIRREVAARQSEVDDCNSRKQFVQSKLAQWPNSWPAGLFPDN